MPTSLPPAYVSRLTSLLIIAAMLAVVAAYLFLDDPLKLITPTAAVWLRWFNVITATVAFLGLMIIVTPRWSAYPPAFRDAILTLLIYLFVVAGGSGRALAIVSMPNEFAVAAALGNIGALRILYRSWHGDYAAFRGSSSA